MTLLCGLHEVAQTACSVQAMQARTFKVYEHSIFSSVRFSLANDNNGVDCRSGRGWQSETIHTALRRQQMNTNLVHTFKELGHFLIWPWYLSLQTILYKNKLYSLVPSVTSDTNVLYQPFVQWQWCEPSAGWCKNSTWGMVKMTKNLCKWLNKRYVQYFAYTSATLVP